MKHSGPQARPLVDRGKPGRRKRPRSGVMQRAASLGVCLLVLVAGVSSAPALEVQDKSKAPAGWWEATSPMAIPPQYFDQVLSAYGLTLKDTSKAPPTYCRKDGDKVVWETAPR